ncbi:hypothetical protein EI020_24160, partial [Escherichia coli]|uniref:hypothetical protein n=1 Tax=Escherichia coli TaxID=562 RepID=UPI00128F8984
MPILNPTANEVFVVRSYKVFQGTVWANNYEIRVTSDSVTTAGLQQAALNIVNAERQFHFDFVEFWKHVISTYVPDSVPYNPLSFISVNTSLNGQRVFSQATEALPFSTCVFVRFTSLTGRPGKRYYRGCLLEQDVGFGPKGHRILPAVRNAIQTALASLLPEVAPTIDLVLAARAPTPT